MFLFVCLQFCGCSTDNIGVFGTFGCKTLAIMLICIGDGIRDSLVQCLQWGYPSRALRKTGRKTLWWEDYETGWRLQLLRQCQPLILQWKRHCYIICPKRKKSRSINICQHGQERTGQSTRYGNGRFFWNTEGTLRTEANKRPNQENGNPDHLLRHPYCQCSTIGKENRKGRT